MGKIRLNKSRKKKGSRNDDDIASDEDLVRNALFSPQCLRLTFSLSNVCILASSSSRTKNEKTR